MPSAIPTLKTLRPVAINYADATVNDFSRGLAFVQNETALPPGATIVGDNIVINEDNSVSVRFGYSELYEFPTTVVDTTYFADRVIAFLADGRIFAYNYGTNTAVAIWNTAIAAALPSAPAAWGATTHIDFTEYKGDLIVVNGTDKPLRIQPNLAVTYLQDLATGSNVNTPIAKFIATANNYVVMVGVTGSNEVYISSFGTSGVWFGDPAPNTAIIYDLAGASGKGNAVYKGLTQFREWLFVFFENFVVLVSLGETDSDGNHTPRIVDTFTDIDIINHRSTLQTEDELYIMAQQGLFATKKVAFGGTVENANVAADLGDRYTDTTALLSATPGRCFICRDVAANKIIMRLICGINDVDTTFVMNLSRDKKKKRWTQYKDWPARTFANSYRKRLFFAAGDTLHLQGNSIFDDEAFHADAISTINEDGNTINFDWELPWTNFGSRAKAKKLVNLTMETEGSAQFLFEMYTDNFRIDIFDDRIPALAMTFVAGNTVGFGAGGGGGYGGGRKANDERFYNMPAKFKIAKMRFSGAIRDPLTLSSYTVIYIRGHYKP